MNFFKKLFTKEKKESLDKGLKKSNDSFFNKISKVVIGKSKVDDQVLDDLEEVLISSDVGVKTTLKIIDQIEQRVAKDKFLNSSELDLILKEEIIKIICDSEDDDSTGLGVIVDVVSNPLVVGLFLLIGAIIIVTLFLQSRNQSSKINELERMVGDSTIIEDDEFSND